MPPTSFQPPARGGTVLSFWGTGCQLTEFALVAVVGAAPAPGGAVGVGVVVALAVTIAFLLALRGAIVAVLALVVGLLLAWVGLVA